MGALKWAMKAVDNMPNKMDDEAVKTPEAPMVPKAGCKFSGKSVANLPPNRYVLSANRINIATAVYNMPKLPSNEKGAKLLKFLSKHKGNNIVVVTVNNTGTRLTTIPVDKMREVKVSRRIIE